MRKFKFGRKALFVLAGLALMSPVCGEAFQIKAALADDGVLEQMTMEFRALFAPDSTVRDTKMWEDGRFVIHDIYGNEYKGCKSGELCDPGPPPGLDPEYGMCGDQPCSYEPPPLAPDYDMCGTIPCSADPPTTPVPTPTPDIDGVICPPTGPCAVHIDPLLWLPLIGTDGLSVAASGDEALDAYICELYEQSGLRCEK